MWCVEKHVCDSLIGTIIYIQGNIKDGNNYRLYMVMGIRQELSPEELGKRTCFPPTCHTLFRKGKKLRVFAWYKVPQGYSSNVKKLISKKYLKLIFLKPHDSHVLMQQLLPNCHTIILSSLIFIFQFSQFICILSLLHFSQFKIMVKVSSW